MPFDREIHPEALESAFEAGNCSSRDLRSTTCAATPKSAATYAEIVEQRRANILASAKRSRELLEPPAELKGKLYSARDLLSHRLADIDRQNADLVGKGFSTMRKS